MVIDLILDRKGGAEYDPKKFYDAVMAYGSAWPEIAHPIADALDNGTEEDVKRELSLYVAGQDYPEAISDYVNSVEWIGSPPLRTFTDAKGGKWIESTMEEWDGLNESQREIIVGPRGTWFAKKAV
jgi:hypothetical protein